MHPILRLFIFPDLLQYCIWSEIISKVCGWRKTGILRVIDVPCIGKSDEMPMPWLCDNPDWEIVDQTYFFFSSDSFSALRINQHNRSWFTCRIFIFKENPYVSTFSWAWSFRYAGIYISHISLSMLCFLLSSFFIKILRQ